MMNKTVKTKKNSRKHSAHVLQKFFRYVYPLWARLESLATPLRRHAKNLSLIAFVVVVGTYVSFPKLVNADMALRELNMDSATVAMIIQSMQNETVEFGRLPVADSAPARRHYTIPITAYTSDVAQTDDTPCITASGLDVCERNIENVVAANFLPIGTRVKIPELYGDRVFYVEDRMNKRYTHKMDIWMKDIQDARQFGLKFATIEVF